MIGVLLETFKVFNFHHISHFLQIVLLNLVVPILNQMRTTMILSDITGLSRRFSSIPNQKINLAINSRPQAK